MGLEGFKGLTLCGCNLIRGGLHGHALYTVYYNGYYSRHIKVAYLASSILALMRCSISLSLSVIGKFPLIQYLSSFEHAIKGIKASNRSVNLFTPG